MMTRDAIRQRFLDQVSETPDGFTSYSAPCGVSIGIASGSLSSGIPASLNQSLSSIGYGLKDAKAIDWGALIAAVAPLIAQSFAPKSGDDDEPCSTYESDDGSYCIIPKSFMDRCKTDEGQLCIAGAIKVLTGREVGAGIMAIILQILPVLLPAVLPLIIGGCA